MWSHPNLPYSLTLSGKDGDNAGRYQEKDVRNALRDLQGLEEPENEGE
ncbi:MULTISPECIES: hypothetical protein [Nostocales]|uniref:Uncharacterized protein n=2 Tax=Nostocales TaxID=1161 RepID=A0ABW8WZ19_9CYAN